ncbi:3-isopropylmalate dehydratase small subunit [Priestia flexa]|uniref:3-isopropylmalate dehydratase small subunit n=1 Tax=Priestia flexa TaxID=86664 RepID=UPI001CFC7F52|nr:3-isopropylmalate dehydratase small subunit [Priestia flexa]UIR30728.1 3-isopropylmalate dehydratase small subunit [Priestia flexa]
MSREHINGQGVPLFRNNIDTDQIIPARFCYQAKRSGHGNSLFGDWREDPSFVLNDSRYSEGTILVAGREFATGSSREYAVWAIKDYGFKVVIAQSFGDIFYKNAIINDLLPLKTTEQGIETLWSILVRNPNALIEIDLEAETINIEDYILPAIIAPNFKKKYILNLDDIEQTLEDIDCIKGFEKVRSRQLANTLRRKEGISNVQFK